MEKVILKKESQQPTEELLTSMIGKLVYASVNMFPKPKKYPSEMDSTVNFWFAGTVAGVDKRTLSYDYDNDSFLEQPRTTYALLLTDGNIYSISTTACEIEEISKELFAEMVDRERKIQEAKQSIIIP